MVTLTGTFTRLDGSPASGAVRVTPSRSPIMDSAGRVVISGPQTFPLDKDGKLAVEIPASNDPDLGPAFTNTVEALLSHKTWKISKVWIPHGSTTVDLSEIGDYTPTPGVATRTVTIPADGTDGQVLMWDGAGFNWADMPEIAVGPDDVRDAVATAISQDTTITQAATTAVTQATENIGLPISVKTFGATGDGTTDDSAAIATALNTAGGGQVIFPPGTYLVTNIGLPEHANIRLDPAATLLHKSGGALPMFLFQPTTISLKIRGGTINGNRRNMAGWPSIITADLTEGKSIDIEDVLFTGTVRTVARIREFGGYLNFSHNKVRDQAQHSGVAGQFTTVIEMVNGQAGLKGVVRTNHNHHHFDDVLDHEGSNPGGYFLCTSPDVGGGVTPDGNLSTWEATGNYFYGYGQFGGPGTGTNDISPLHTYPTFKGARWTNNYFEQCGFPAMSAKSVEDFVCTGNVVVDGMRSSRNHASEGAISYVPGYQAGSLTRPRAVISNNVVSNPGGEPVLEQTGIAVKGTSTSKATDVIVSNNVYSGGGVGVDLVNVENAVVSSNILRCVKGTSPADSGIGVRFSNVEGQVLVSGNSIEGENGNNIVGISGNSGAEVVITGNELVDLRAAAGANILFRDCVSLKVSGNVMRSNGGQALNLGGVISRYSWDESNSIDAGTVAINWTSIAAADGQLVGAGTPVGKVRAAHAGVTYRQTDGSGSATLFLATGTGVNDWSLVQTAATGAVAIVNTPSIVYGTNSAGEPVHRRAVGGERTAGQIPVYGTSGDLVVANTPGTNASATSKSYVAAELADLEARVTGVDTGGTPTITPGAAAGTGATVAISGTDRAGTITLTPGESPSSGGWATVTFSKARSTAPTGVIIVPANTTAAAQVAPRPFVASKGVNSFVMSVASSGTVSTIVHEWTYHVI